MNKRGVLILVVLVLFVFAGLYVQHQRDGISPTGTGAQSISREASQPSAPGLPQTNHWDVTNSMPVTNIAISAGLARMNKDGGGNSPASGDSVDSQNAPGVAIGSGIGSGVAQPPFTPVSPESPSISISNTAIVPGAQGRPYSGP